MLAFEGLTLAQADAPPVVSESSQVGPAPTGERTATPGSSETVPIADDPAANGGAGPGGGNFSLLLIILMVGVFWFIMMGGQRKEKKKRAAMLAALSKGAKVQTVGGILGTIVEVRDTDVVVKVDENSNTRMRFAKSAIQSVLEDKEE